MSNHTERWAGEHATPAPADIREILDVVLTISDLAPEELAAIRRIYRCLARTERPGDEYTVETVPLKAFDIVAPRRYTFQART